MADHYYTTPEILAISANNPYRERLVTLVEQRCLMPLSADRDMINLEISTLMERVNTRKKMHDSLSNGKEYNHDYVK